MPAIRRYLVIVVLGNLAWEFAQMPLYKLWKTGTPGEVAWQAIHCSAGDLLIAMAALAASVLLFGGIGWPRLHVRRVAGTCLGIGLFVTVVVERLATGWGLWTYSEAMPVLPGLGVGLAPVAQWVVIPLVALWSAAPPLRGG